MNSVNIIRLKSCYGKYLTASNQSFLLGMTGRKVLQTLPKRLDSSVEWGSVWDNGAVKLKTRYDRFLRANGGLPPWRNSVTHDVPHRTVTKEWVLWEVHVVDILPVAATPPPTTVVVGREEVLAPETRNDVCGGGGYSPAPASFSRHEVINFKLIFVLFVYYIVKVILRLYSTRIIRIW
ncbi:hypothetical protein PHJA_001985900 [Phtheirospermum japonicum]|uniref:DUF569 domain-containing protein n=1 Tax=Phtheirospermum japonicum TaxID=374723 RepID=A0A830CFJ3_9LAMI|nr:hypothetical protein PHJA_001985900 [Phtheirospermum japonicum]